MNSCLIDLYFFPPIAYFKSILNYNELIIEANDNFVKQTYRNRAHFLAPNGVQQLNIPVIKAQSKQLYRAVKIDYSENWIRKNHQALKSAYSNSPFFNDYYPFIEGKLNKNQTFLFDLNLSLLDFCIEVLQIDKIITPTQSFELTYTNKVDLRELKVGKRKNISDWLPNDIKSYQQMFGKEFVKNLSILDLMFNKGPESIKFLV